MFFRVGVLVGRRTNFFCLYFLLSGLFLFWTSKKSMDSGAVEHESFFEKCNIAQRRKQRICFFVFWLFHQVEHKQNRLESYLLLILFLHFWLEVEWFLCAEKIDIFLLNWILWKYCWSCPKSQKRRNIIKFQKNEFKYLPLSQVITLLISSRQYGIGNFENCLWQRKWWIVCVESKFGNKIAIKKAKGRLEFYWMADIFSMFLMLFGYLKNYLPERFCCCLFMFSSTLLPMNIVCLAFFWLF